MTNLDLIIITGAILLSYIIGRWSTNGESWESAAKKYLKLVEFYRQSSDEWQKLAEKHRNEIL